jgi:hypothetical protein
LTWRCSDGLDLLLLRFLRFAVALGHELPSV